VSSVEPINLDLPVYSRQRETVPARHYNLWRLARSRLGLPLRLALPGLKGLELVLQEDAWVCVDPQMSDYPIVAWTGFQAAGRDALDAPVDCDLLYFHMGATLVRSRVLKLMLEILEQRLAPQRHDA